MIRVAFCCHGNICRSTLSESVFTHKVNALGLGDQFIIDSFATSREEILLQITAIIVLQTTASITALLAIAPQ